MSRPDGSAARRSAASMIIAARSRCRRAEAWAATGALRAYGRCGQAVGLDRPGPTDPSGTYRRPPTDRGAAGLEQDDDATNAGNVEGRLHDLGAGFGRLGDACVDIVDRNIAHP